MDISDALRRDFGVKSKNETLTLIFFSIDKPTVKLTSLEWSQ